MVTIFAASLFWTTFKNRVNLQPGIVKYFNLKLSMKEHKYGNGYSRFIHAYKKEILNRDSWTQSNKYEI